MVKKPVYDYSKMDSTTKKIHKRIEKFLEKCITEGDPVEIVSYTRIDSLKVDAQQEHVDIFLNRFFSFIPFREDNVHQINMAVKDALGWWYNDYTFKIYTTGTTIEQLIPNYYRTKPSDYDLARMPAGDERGSPLVENISRQHKYSNGLYNRNIALWHSHGWYYEQSLQRWEWQRARLFQTVEDLGPIMYTLPYLVPMLENAGANVFLPRERDFQLNEVIVDNDSFDDSLNTYYENWTDSSNTWQDGNAPGFAVGNPPYSAGENPFETGGYRLIRTQTETTAEVSWIPYIPESGHYAVYISWARLENAAEDARYTVYHAGGKTEYSINQQIGGPTWIYLGKFKFIKGNNPETGRVELTNRSNVAGKWISADAVKFGGGMGNVEREGKTSGRPRYVEGARYWLQYAGMPDTLVYSFNDEKSDYRDDYQSRAEWVNFLKGAPFGPNLNRENPGLGIPMDLSLAFHTDAGITHNDTVIGTLSIYCTQAADTVREFPDGMSRYANRDFADIMQTQIVDDIRQIYDPAWTRRGLWDRGYSEAYRPNVPSALLELLSHQNFIDTRFMQEPKFRFDVSRAIYKSMLRFLATQFGYDYVVQPLPVTHLQAEFTAEGTVMIKWREQPDPLEKTALADKYVVYTRLENGGFDNGTITTNPSLEIKEIENGRIYSFKVCALNSGGESMPSEIISICKTDDWQTPVLIINGFDRISAAAIVNEDNFKGFADFLDQGVPDRYDLGYVGSQFNFKPRYPWLDDDAPGFGASHADFETKPMPGNTFDYIFIHGQAIHAAGYSFVSGSDEAVIDGRLDLSKYKILDLILGEEKETYLPKQQEPLFITWPEKMQKYIADYCQSGGNIFVSGAYVGTDIWEKTAPDSQSIRFALNSIKFKWRTDHASKSGRFYGTDSAFFGAGFESEFISGYDQNVYAAEAPDGIEPADSTAKTILRYTENNISAAVASSGQNKTVVLGFPFETIAAKADRIKMMKYIMAFLNE